MMNLLFFNFCFCLCVSFCYAQTQSDVKQTTDTTSSIILVTNSSIEEKCNETIENIKESGRCIIVVEEGYQIEITIESANLSGETDDYILILPGSSLNDTNTGRIFTRVIKKPKQYIIAENTAYVIYNKTSADAAHGFTIKWRRYGDDPTTTLVPPTTPIDWPSPNDDEKMFHTVYITGVSAKEFAERENEFNLLMVNMSQAYCQKYNIRLAQDITVKNIHINLAIRCNVLWPNSETCVEVRYAIPVLLKNVSGYELSVKNLELMWNEYAQKGLNEFGWSEFDVPDDESNFMLWIIIIIIILAVFLGLLFVIKSVSFKMLAEQMKRKMSDTEQIMATPNRVSDASLWPDSNQIVPPIFDNDLSYSYYEIDMNNSITATRMYDSTNNNTLDVDDSSDEEILNRSRISPKSTNNQFITLTDETLTNKNESAL